MRRTDWIRKNAHESKVALVLMWNTRDSHTHMDTRKLGRTDLHQSAFKFRFKSLLLQIKQLVQTASTQRFTQQTWCIGIKISHICTTYICLHGHLWIHVHYHPHANNHLWVYTHTRTHTSGKSHHTPANTATSAKLNIFSS